MVERVRIGILGLGKIGELHARAIGDISDRAHVVAASGGGTEVLSATGWPDAVHLSVDELLSGRVDIDIIVVCTPSDAHGAHVLKALDAARGVVVEKPLATTAAEAAEIVARASERNSFVSVIAQRRFEPEMVHLKGLVDAGRLGRIRLGEVVVHWFRDDEYYAQGAWRSTAPGGGSLFNQGLHDVDLLQWLLGPAAKVTALSATLGRSMEAEDTTLAAIQFASGALGSIVTTTATPPGFPSEMSMFSDRGSFTLANGRSPRWDFDGVPPPQELTSATGSSVALAIGTTGHVRQWVDILDAFTSGREPLVTARDGLETVRLITSIYESARTGEHVRLL